MNRASLDMSSHQGNNAVGNPGAISCPVPFARHEHILLGHGSGGRLTNDLIDQFFRPIFDDDALRDADDSAVLTFPEDHLKGGEVAVSTDAHVVKPLVFPGGDIGRLSICGTVNDIAMVGARPVWISVAFIIEEGLSTDLLIKVARSMKEAADEAGVRIVAGDTKVAERGNVDGLYITTTGVGIIPPGRHARSSNIQSGDAVILSGPIGNHGMAVLAARGDLALRAQIESDTAPLNHLVEAIYASGADVHALRDPTRGGVSAALNEMARSSEVSILVEEDLLPVDQNVDAACELLGFDPLHVANEGKLIAFVPEAQVESVLPAMRATRYGEGACRIGRVATDPVGRVLLETGIGGTRLIDMPAGELLPRIC